MQIVGLPTWLEKAIGGERDAVSIAKAICQRDEFIDLIRAAVQFAESAHVPGVDPDRLVAEDIAVRLHRLFDEFKTMH